MRSFFVVPVLLGLWAPPAAAESANQCELTASGAKSAHETVPGGPTSVMTEYWMGDREKAAVEGQKGLTRSVVDALQLFTVNCIGKEIHLSILPGQGASRQMIPFGPKTYKLDKGKGDLAVLVSVSGSHVVSPSGTLAVTAFDDKHLEVQVELAGKTMKKEDIKISGKIDYACSLSGCKK